MLVIILKKAKIIILEYNIQTKESQKQKRGLVLFRLQVYLPINILCISGFEEQKRDCSRYFFQRMMRGLPLTTGG